MKVLTKMKKTLQDYTSLVYEGDLLNPGFKKLWICDVNEVVL
jgi:hypothetical protein